MSKKILEDHKKEGKRLKPPLTTIGNFVDLSWVDYIIPDVIWITLLKDKFGDKLGTELVNEFIVISTKHESSKFRNYALISSFEILPSENKIEIFNDLNRKGIVSPLLAGLSDFLDMYPKCPLNFIRPNDYSTKVIDVKFLLRYKEILWDLIDKRSKKSTFTIANVVYSMFVLDRLKIVKDSPMTQFPKIQEYPDTEISRIIASSLRASINAFYNVEMFYKDNSTWAKEFWNRGIEIEACKL
jgi:hypothetical protein